MFGKKPKDNSTSQNIEGANQTASPFAYQPTQAQSQMSTQQTSNQQQQVSAPVTNAVPAKPKKKGIVGSFMGLIFPSKNSKQDALKKPPIDPETGGIHHSTVDRKFKKMRFMEKYSYRGTRAVFIIGGIIFFIIAFYLGYLLVRALLPAADSDHDNVPDLQDKCPGYNDSIDQDKDGIPDNCDTAVTPGDFSDITFSEPSLVTADDKVYDVVFTITDANKTWGVTNLKFKVEVMGADGTVLKSLIDTRYVNPGSSTVIIEPNISTSNKAVSAKATFLSGEFAANASTQNIPLNIGSKTFTPRTTDGTALFTGVLQNNSNFDLKVVNVTMVVKSGDGTIVSDNLTNINTLHASENRYFELRFPTSLDPSVTYEVVATTNNMDKGNLTSKQGSGSQF